MTGLPRRTRPVNGRDAAWLEAGSGPPLVLIQAEAIGGARLVEIADAGHFPQLEQPAAVKAAIREFLASLPRAPSGGLAGMSA